MAKLKYRLDFNDSDGLIESYDLENLKGIRDEIEWKGKIIALEIIHFIENDPQKRAFNSWEEAHDAVPALGEGEFFISSSETILNPQPDNLN